MPFTEYSISVAVTNPYAEVFFEGQGFTRKESIRTLEGGTCFFSPLISTISSFPPTLTVPSRPTGLQGVVLGTGSVNLTWDVPTFAMLVGDPANRLYRVVLANGATNITVNPTFLVEDSAFQDPLLMRGDQHFVIQVCIIPQGLVQCHSSLDSHQ